MAQNLIERTLEEEDPDRPIEEGDVCHLKGGGPTMTVREIESDLVTVEWFDKAQLRSAKLKLRSLRRGPIKRLPIFNIQLGDASSDNKEPPWNYLKNRSASEDE